MKFNYLIVIGLLSISSVAIAAPSIVEHINNHTNTNHASYMNNHTDHMNNHTDHMNNHTHTGHMRNHTGNF